MQNKDLQSIIMPSKLRKAIGAVKDQTSISLAKVSNNNSANLEVTVLKATTHEDVPIDERYVQEVLYLVSSNKLHAASCARAIGKRISRTRNWIVALKSLMLVLRLFQDGDPYFPREVLHAMKRGAKILNLSSFRDDSNSSPWDYTAFVRTFALYLDERLDCFLTGKLQRRYTYKDRDRDCSSVTYRGGGKRGNEPVRDMKPPMLLDKISFWQRLLERAIGTRPTGSAKTNRLVQISLYAVVQESFDLYRDISDGLALLLDSFFHLQYHSCVIAFQTCVKASKQFEELSAFYSLCKSIGVGRTSEYPSVQTISEELIETLQEFLKDQSSFPVRSPGRPLTLPATSGRHDGYEGSEYSETSTARYSEGVTEYGSQCTSLEDLISATESGRSLHNISIDLEDYSDQFEKKSQGDDAFRVSDTGSTHSLPVSNSMVDLVSLDDWPENDERVQEQDKKEGESSATGWELVLAEVATQWSQQTKTLDSESASTSSQLVQGQDKKEEELVKTSSTTSWELVLADASTQRTQQTPDLFNNFDSLSASTSSQPIQEQDKKEEESSSTMGWELVLAETATQWTHQTPNTSNIFYASSLDSLYNQTPLQPSNTFDVSSLDNLYNQSPLSSHRYNPFLQETIEIPAVPTTTTDFETAFLGNTDTFSSAPTFQVTPTFSAKNPNDTFGSQDENDPFGTFASEQLFNGSANQQNLLHEQQLWLQQQNKIIAKHMS